MLCRPAWSPLLSSQTIASRDRKIIQPCRCIYPLQLPLHTSPEFTRYASSRARVPFAEQIG
jgi:hypothetical protein